MISIPSNRQDAMSAKAFMICRPMEVFLWPIFAAANWLIRESELV
jgi:hypothetical protein